MPDRFRSITKQQIMAYSKYYVVWVGRHPGIYESWEECQAETDGFPNARYKAFSNRTEAILAYRESDKEASQMLRAIANHLKEEDQPVDYSMNPEIQVESIAVDAGCRGNPGIMEYRGVYVRTGQEIFRVGPYHDGTNNIGEFLAIVHGLALLKKKGSNMPIYSDSKIAQKWVRDKKCNTKLLPTERNGELLAIVRRAEAWLQSNTYSNPIIKWETERWGEIPADFGRK